jgi:hypothetical protein
MVYEIRPISSVLITKYYSGDQIKKNEMGRANDTYGDRRGAYKLLWGDLRERDHLEDLHIDGRRILK